MVRDARQGHRASSGLLLAGGQVLAVAACPVALTGRADWPVLVATKIARRRASLSGIAERAGGAVAISDGRRLLVAATTAAPAARRRRSVRAASRRSIVTAPGLVTLGNETVAALPLPGGLRVLVGIAAPASAGARLPLPWPALVDPAARRGVRDRPLRDPARGTPPASPSRRWCRRPMATGVTTIGRYTIVERIGQGGMAEIYSAVTAGDGSFRRPVVIKRLRPELSIDPNAVAQFCDEANLLAALHHPNIVAVHDFGRSQSQYFLAEEYVVGRDLGRLVERRFREARRPPPVEVIAYVGVEVLKALEYAHGLTNEMGRPLGIVHRDVSPENVMVSARGEVKLLDFGVVKASEGRLTRTEVGVVKGNVTYMAPEQARGLEVDARADLYSLALVLYMLRDGTAALRRGHDLRPPDEGGRRPRRRGSIGDPRPAPPAGGGRRSRHGHAHRGPLPERARDGRRRWKARHAAARPRRRRWWCELFGAELKEEAQRMATFSQQDSAASVAGASSG